jgi:hypothetical protein
MNEQIDIKEAIELVNKKTTTVDRLCHFLYSDIETFKESREAHYLEQFKEEFTSGEHGTNLEKVADEQTDIIFRKIQKDTKEFASKYAEKSIDLVLDAKNQNKFKTKRGFENLLVLLSTLKEINEES